MAHLAPFLKQRYFDANGDPLVGGKLYSYAAGTSTPLATYTDQGGLTTNTNPVILDANGEASVWIGTSAYKFVLKDSNDVTLFTQDNVSFVNDDSITKEKIAPDVAGSGLGQNADGSLEVSTDNATIEVASDQVRVKDLGITAAKLSATAVTPGKLASKLAVVKSTMGDFIPQMDWTSPLKVTTTPTLAGASGKFVAWSGNTKFLAFAELGGTKVSLYERSGSTFIKGLAATTTPTIGEGAAFSPSGEYLAIADTNAPYLLIYRRQGTTLTKLADPGTLPAGSAFAVAWSPDNQFLVLAHSDTNGINIYQRAGDTFTKLSDPSTTPAGSCLAAAWSLDGQYLAIAHNASPYITVYQRSGTTFTKLTNPTTLPPARGVGVAFSPDGTLLAVAHDSSPYVTIYSLSGTTLTKLSNPATLPDGNCQCVSFSPSGSFLALGLGASPYINTYAVSGTTFTKQSNPASLPAGSVNGIAFSPDEQFLALAHDTTPYFTLYKTSFTLPSNAVLYMKEVLNV